MADIRFFFTPTDIDHMGKRGIDLATYEGVKANAIRILGATEPPDGEMPPDPASKWSQARWGTFKNWIVNNYPLGVANSQASLLMAEAIVASRLRKDARNLSPDQINTLKTAFVGVMRLAPENPNSYFAQAAVHWLPGRLPGPTFYCLHHENRYNPWHRTYLHPFENALRSIPGCENVALPYWDITSPIPDFLYQPPFDKYVLPRDIGADFAAGYVTSRYSASEVMDKVRAVGIPGQIDQAMAKSAFPQFNKLIIMAHDNGHVSTGDTMRQQDVAAYDPIFWFFHANLDRLWWKWQQTVGATNLQGFLTTVTGSTDWLKTTPFNALPPFSETADRSIDLRVHDVDYDHPKDEKPTTFGAPAFGSLEAAALRGLHSAGKAGVRVKGIDRLNIPGSFMIRLQADGKTIASQAFFQARNPRSCVACVKQSKVDIDLEVDIDQLRGAPLRVVIEPMWPDAMGATFPLSAAGNPTVNIRLLLQ